VSIVNEVFGRSDKMFTLKQNEQVLSHVKKTMKAEAGMKKSMGKKWFSHVLKSAKKTYKKGGAHHAMGGRRHRKGGEESESDEEAPMAAPMMAGKRRGGKTQRRRK